jgi:CheY-like chemotaxis protein
MRHLLSINLALVVGAIIVLGVALWRMLSTPPSPAVSILWQQREGSDDGLSPPSGREHPVSRTPADQQPARRSAAPASTHARGNASSGALAPVSVLLVEDDDDSRQMLTDTLRYYGAHVVAVSTAAEALQVLNTHHTDVLLSDLRLPEKDGFALIHELRLRSDPAIAMIPAASITASRLTEDRHHALAAGYQVHMEKPVDPDDLVSTVLTLAATPRDNDRIEH